MAMPVLGMEALYPALERVVRLTRMARLQVLDKTPRRQECVLWLTRTPRPHVLSMSLRRPARITTSVRLAGCNRVKLYGLVVM